MSEPTYSPAPQAPADRSVKIPHLVFGLLFLGVAGIWALGTSNVISGERLAILGPAVLIAAGLIGLVASLANGRSRRRAGNQDSGFYPESTAPIDRTPNELTSNDRSPNDRTPNDRTNHAPTDRAVTDDDEHTEEIR